MIKISKILSLTVATLVSNSANAATFFATSRDIQSVFKIAQGGDTINLSGDFQLTRLQNRDFGKNMTINASMARFTDSLSLKNVSNVTIINSKLGSKTANTSFYAAADVFGGSNVSFVNPNVIGYYTGHGISFNGTNNATVQGGVFNNLKNSVVFYNVLGGKIQKNKSIASITDGFNVSNSKNIFIANNSCTGTLPIVGAHPDCVQIMSTPGSAGSDNIVVRDNYASGATQGFTNFGSKSTSTRLSFIDNRVDGLFAQGVACYNCTDSIITGNVLTTMDGAPYRVSVNVVGGKNNIVSNNSVGALNRSAVKNIVYYTREQLTNGKSVNPTAMAAVPEPQEWVMLIVGMGLVGAMRRRQFSQLAA